MKNSSVEKLPYVVTDSNRKSCRKIHRLNKINGDLFRYQDRKLKRLTSAQCEAIIYGVIWPYLTGEPTASSMDQVDMSFDIISGMEIIQQNLYPLVPRPCTFTKISAAAGKFVPALKYVLSEHTLKYQEREVAAILADMNPMTTKGSQSISGILPRLFSLAPLPRMKWRFVDLNTKSLMIALSLPHYTSDYEGNKDVFNEVFDLDR